MNMKTYYKRKYFDTHTPDQKHLYIWRKNNRHTHTKKKMAIEYWPRYNFQVSEYNALWL